MSGTQRIQARLRQALARHSAADVSTSVEPAVRAAHGGAIARAVQTPAPTVSLGLPAADKAGPVEVSVVRSPLVRWSLTPVRDPVSNLITSVDLSPVEVLPWP